ncbi:MAG: hypothetical protein JXA93_11580 [Anaerolineae bacterium]|nr:hypothetical protein [Anaerolineae bacterium]
MDYGQILKRSWHMVRHYRALWILGIILGLVTFSWGWALLGNGDDERPSPRGLVITRLDGESFYDALARTLQQEMDDVEEEMSAGLRELDLFFRTEPGREFAVDAVTVLVILAVAFVATAVVTKIARYVSEAALIRMVGEYEDTGERMGIKQGLRLGLSHTAWHLFLIDLVIDVPVILAFLALFALAFGPLILGITSDTSATVIAGSLLSGGFFAAGIALAIVAGTALSLLKRFFRQACALESLGALASIRRGWAVVRQKPVDVLVMWLIMVGIGLGWGVAVALSFVVLFPLLLLFIAIGGVVGALPAYLVYFISSLLFEGAVPVVLAIVVGLPIFILVMLAPWWCAGGLMQVFESSVWTLTYRQLRTVGEVEPARVRAVDATGTGAVPAT